MHHAAQTLGSPRAFQCSIVRQRGRHPLLTAGGRLAFSTSMY
jgi:hypothetical protein